MELATTQSVLMQIQPTIQRFARMLASVLQLEVEIVDENLCRVAGTGAYGKFLGRQLSGNSRLLRHVLETKTEKVVTQSRFDPLCEGCDSKENCREKAFLGTPVILQDRCVGVISLIAVTTSNKSISVIIYANFLITFAIYPPFLFRNFWRIRGQEITSVKYLRP